MLRLTLRTLLAWLDGVLPADEAKAFAEKLGSSGSARILVDRIRAVVAHPGLDAPKVLGRGLAADANSVAEYLTNSLPADSVAAFERVCIESDAHLAEVAACHRMLVEARNDPSIFEPPEPHELDRLLAATREASQWQPSRASSASVAPRPRHPSVVLPPPPGNARKTSKKSTSKAAWASVTVAVLLVALLAGAIAWRLWPKGVRESMSGGASAVAVREPPPAETQPQASQSDDTTLERDPAAPQTRSAPQEPTARETDPPAVLPPTDPRPAVLAPTDPRPAVLAPTDPRPAVSPPTGPRSEESPPAGRVPGGDALAIGAKPPQGPAGEPTVAVSKPVEAAAAVERPKPGAAAVATVAGGPLVLVRATASGGPADWKVLQTGDAVAPSADLLVPEGFSPTLAVGNATVRLIGPARVVFRPAGDAATDDAAVAVELVFGRAIVGGVGKGRPLAVVAGDLMAMLHEGDPIGLEVQFERSPGSDPETVPSTAESSIAFPAGGRLSLDPTLAANLPAAAFEGGVIRPDGSIATGGVITARGAVATGAASAVAATIGASRAMPGWMAASPPPLLERLAADAMAACLAAAPAPAALDRLLEDSRLENRAAAAATLAIMGRYHPLAELLAAEEPGRRLPARAWEMLERATVPFALARGPASAGRMLAALESVAPPDAGKLVRQLAVGFSDEQVAGGGDTVLVAALDHPSLLVRRLAAARLLEAVPVTPADRLRYRADGPPAARAEAVKWWRTQLEKGRIRGGREGGLSKAEGE